MLLHIALVDFGRGGEAGAQRMARKLLFPLAFGEIAAHTGGQDRALDQPGYLLIVKSLGANRFALTSDTAEQWAIRDAGKLQPGL